MLMSGVTCSLRFPGQLNADLRKLAVNLIPFPRMHFFVGALAPLTSRGSQPYCAQSPADLVWQLFDDKNKMSACNPRRGAYLAGSMHFRGELSSWDVEEQVRFVQARHSSYFVEWIPSNLMVGLCDIPPRGLKTSATFVANTTAFREPLCTIDGQFSRLYARRVFVHWYVNEGLETVEFDEARSNFTDLIQEYEMYETVGVEEWDDSDYEDNDHDE
jgi:tubulin beta